MEGVREDVRESVIGFPFCTFFFGSFRRFPRGFYKNITSYSPDFSRLQAFFAVFYGVFIANYRVNSGAGGETNGKTGGKNNAIVL